MAEHKPIFDVEKARLSIETGKRGKWGERRGSKSKGFKYFDKDINSVLFELNKFLPSEEMVVLIILIL